MTVGERTEAPEPLATVNIAELKDQLSSFLRRVRAGEELVVRDRNLPIAKIVPLRGEDMDPEEVSLVASGQMTLPKQELDEKRFWAIGGGIKSSRNLANAMQRAIAADREDYRGLLDTSAIIHICLPGQSTSAAKRVLTQQAVVVWWTARVEVRSVLERLRKEAAINSGAYDASGGRLDALLASWREIQPTESLRELACIQLERFSIRAADALHLSAALTGPTETTRKTVRL